MTVKTRFAPSPTGYLHIGGARTALFCWLHARQANGSFILRIEDTDRERSTEEYVTAILEGMRWLDLQPDEGPYYQSERMPRYREVIDRLLAEGHAYRCYCSKERLEALREAQMARKEKPRYDGHCRDLTAPPEGATESVVRFRNPQEGQVVVDDLIRGRVTFSNEELDDLIIARTDGSPTYNLTVVVDDMDMAVSHVIRGDDHLNNTPRQVNILEALGVEPPAYAHVPMILGHDGKRLSKRHGAVSVLQYRDDGYLPEALINYLVRLGWAHGDQEIFSREELLEFFDLKAVNKAASTFNPDKLLWLNQHYLKTLPPGYVAEHLRPHLEALGLDIGNGPPLDELVTAQRERAKTLMEMAENSAFFFRDIGSYDEKAFNKHMKAEVAPVLEALHEQLAALGDWRAERIHEAVLAVAEAHALKLGKVAQPVRVAVSGGAVSPPIDQTLSLLGRERTLARLQQALARMPHA